MTDLIAHDLHYIGAARGIIGVDEVGRGAFAGPVVAAATYLRQDFFQLDWCKKSAKNVNDSKQLKATQRQTIFEELQELLKQNQIKITLGEASVEEIDSINILNATTLAMNRAIEQLEADLAKEIPSFSLPKKNETPSILNLNNAPNNKEEVVLLIDGRPVKASPFQHHGIIKGDGKSMAIALASIYAKVSRDIFMEQLDAKYPGYGFASHKGYGTANHQRAIIDQGPSNIHRKTFLKKLYAKEKAMAKQAELEI